MRAEGNATSRELRSKGKIVGHHASRNRGRELLQHVCPDRPTRGRTRSGRQESTRLVRGPLLHRRLGSALDRYPAWASRGRHLLRECPLRTLLRAPGRTDRSVPPPVLRHLLRGEIPDDRARCPSPECRPSRRDRRDREADGRACGDGEQGRTPQDCAAWRFPVAGHRVSGDVGGSRQRWLPASATWCRAGRCRRRQGHAGPITKGEDSSACDLRRISSTGAAERPGRPYSTASSRSWPLRLTGNCLPLRSRTA